jgi:hypothetical protein
MSVELPAGVTELAPTDPPLRDLLAAATSGSRPVTTDLHDKLSAGAALVTFTAWDGAPTTGKVAAKRTATVFVLPTGFTQAGVSGDENATAGNNATRIARDSTGYVHMVWVDSGRPGGNAGPVYRRAAVAPDGTVQFETPPTYLADRTPGDWNAYPALTVSGDTVDVVWQGGGIARTRRLVFGSAGYVWGPVRDTGAKSEGRDVGPAILTDANTIQIVTPSGMYAISTDAGATWKTEAIPVPPNQHMKTATLAADPAGGTIVAFSSVVQNIKDTAKGEGSGGYWQLRTIRRTPDGKWTDAQDALAAFPAWGQPTGNNDALADWVRIGSDTTGGMHLLWHGTGVFRIYGNDQATYSYRPANGTWSEPITLVSRDDTRGIKFSFAPSLALDGDHAIAAVFYDVIDGNRWGGFDADLIPLRHGAFAGEPLPLTHFIRASIDAKNPAFALSNRFPSVAPVPFHAPDGRVWLDVLDTFIPMGVDDSPKLLVYQRVDVTKLLKP